LFALLALPWSGCLADDLSSFILLLAVPFGLLLAACVAAFENRRRPGGELTIDTSGARLTLAGGKQVAFTRADVFSGHELPNRRAISLVLRGGRDVVIELAQGTPEIVLAYLGASVHDRALTAPLRGELGAFTKGLLTLLVSSIGSLAIFGRIFGPRYIGTALVAAMATTAACTLVMIFRFGFPKVIVGIDGVRIEGGLRRTFLPYSDIHAVHAHASGARIAHKNGQTVNLATIGQSHEQIGALVHRIEQGRTAHARSERRDLGVLAVQGRSIRAWREDLKRVALAPPGFRDHAFSRDDFERLLADPRAPSEQRIGAALALRALDPEAATRIRVAATASANDELRTALEACASSSDDEIDEAALTPALAASRLAP
jgi:hypothetical protein